MGLARDAAGEGIGWMTVSVNGGLDLLSKLILRSHSNYCSWTEVRVPCESVKRSRRDVRGKPNSLKIGERQLSSIAAIVLVTMDESDDPRLSEFYK